MSSQSASPARYSEEWWRVTLSSISDGVIVTDAGGRVTFINPVAESLTGWSGEDAMGRSIEEVFSIINESSRARVESPIHQALTTGNVVELANHAVLLSRDGAEFPIDDSAAPVRDDQGNVFGAVLVFRDVTAQKRAERERKEGLEQLALALQAARLGDWSWDAASDVVTFSERAAEIFGVPPGPHLT